MIQLKILLDELGHKLLLPLSVCLLKGLQLPDGGVPMDAGDVLVDVGVSVDEPSQAHDLAHLKGDVGEGLDLAIEVVLDDDVETVSSWDMP